LPNSDGVPWPFAFVSPWLYRGQHVRKPPTLDEKSTTQPKKKERKKARVFAGSLGRASATRQPWYPNALEREKGGGEEWKTIENGRRKEVGEEVKGKDRVL
jgi:hypothetical protein